MQIWCLERLISLGPLTVIDRSPLKMGYRILLAQHFTGNCHVLGLDSPRCHLASSQFFLQNGSKSLLVNTWDCQGEFGKLMLR